MEILGFFVKIEFLDKSLTFRIGAAIDLRQRRSVRLAYIVRAVTPGQYTFPGAVMEDMYRPDVFGRSESRAVSIAPREG